jgi:hypothetical protein
MKKIIIILAIASLLLPAALRAEDEKELSGKFMLGFRMVDTSGDQNKYREDINLQNGARLQKFTLTYTPSGPTKKLVDEISLSMYNFGGDPFESFSFNMVKYGKYTLSYQRQKSNYFYADDLWTDTMTYWQMSQKTGGDYRTFNFDRVTDRAAAKIWLGKNAHFYFDFDRYTKKGTSTTAFSAFRDLFTFDKPVDMESKEISLGLDYTSAKFNLAFTEKIQEFRDASSIFLPGYSEGTWTGYSFAPNTSVGYSYILDTPYDTTSYTHSAKAVFKPTRNLLIKGGFTLIDLKVNNFSYLEKGKGIDNAGKNSVADRFSTAFDLSRKITLADFDLSYLFSDKLSFVGAFRYAKHDQNGSVTQVVGPLHTPTSSTYPGLTTTVDTTENLSTTGFDAGLQFAATQGLTLTVGFRAETRTIKEAAGDEKTTRTSLFGNVAFNPTPGLNLTADYQSGSYKEPVMLTAPSSQSRLRLTAKYKKGAFFANGSLWLSTIKNDGLQFTDPAVAVINNDWVAKNTNVSLRLGYNNKKLMVSAGWNLISSKSTATDRPFGTAPAIGATYDVWPIFFSGKVNLMDINVSFKASEKWSLGAMLSNYTAPAYYGGYYTYSALDTSATADKPKYTIDENYKNRDLSRLTFKPYIEYVFDGNFLVQLSYYMVDFKDPFKINYVGSTASFDNNYKANILEFSFGYKF